MKFKINNVLIVIFLLIIFSSFVTATPIVLANYNVTGQVNTTASWTADYVPGLYYLKKFKQLNNESDLWDSCVSGFKMDGNVNSMCNITTSPTWSGTEAYSNSLIGLNQSAYFNGVSYINTNTGNYSSLFDNTNFSISYVVRDDSGANSVRLVYDIVNTTAPVQLIRGGVTTTGVNKPYFQVYDGVDSLECDLPTSYTVGETYIITNVFIYPRTAKIYVNGVLEKTCTATADIDINKPSFNDIVISQYHDLTGANWVGTIDELYFFNKALSAEEISSIYYDNLCTSQMNISEDCSDLQMYLTDTEETLPFIPLVNITGASWLGNASGLVNDTLLWDAIMIPSSTTYNVSVNSDGTNNIGYASNQTSQLITNGITNNDTIRYYNFMPVLDSVPAKDFITGEVGTVTSAVFTQTSACEYGNSENQLGCYDFDGNSRIKLSQGTGNIATGDDFSVSAWVDWDGSADTDGIYANWNIVSVGYGFYLAVDTSNVITFPSWYNGGGDVLNTVWTLDNEPHLITITYNSSNRAKAIYVDGVINASSISPGDIWYNANQCEYIGSTDYSGSTCSVANTNGFDGRIMNVVVYNQTLNANQVLGLYGEANQDFEQDIYWTINDASFDYLVLQNTSWETASGINQMLLFINSTLNNVSVNVLFNNVIDYNDVDVNITVTSPSSIVVVDNLAMSNISGNSSDSIYLYNNDIDLDETGYWNISVDGYYNSFSTFVLSSIYVSSIYYSNFSTTESSVFPEIGDIIQLNVTSNSLDVLDFCVLEVNDNTSWINQSNYSSIGTTTKLLNFNFTVRNVSNASNDVVYWRVYCNDTNGVYATSDVQNFTVRDVTNPIITLNPSNSFDSSNLSVVKAFELSDWLNLTLNVTFSDNNLFQSSINISCEYNSSFFYWEQLDWNSTIASYVNNLSLEDMVPQECNYSIQVSDDHTKNLISKYKLNSINNGLKFVTEEENNVYVKLKTEEQKPKPWFSHTDIKKVKSKKMYDRYSLDFEFDESKIVRTFVVSSNHKIYYQSDSKYNGHFVIWNEETKSGNWIDFIDSELVNPKYSVNKINDWEYEVTVSSDNVVDEYTFESVGGTNIYELNGSFFIGGEVIINTNNVYDNNSINNFQYNSSSVSAGSIYTNWTNFFNVTTSAVGVDNTRFTLNNSCFYTNTTLIDVVNYTQNITWNSFESVYNLRIRNVATEEFLGEFNVSLYNYNSSTWTNVTNISSSGYTFYLNSSTYNLTIYRSMYDNYNKNLSLSCRENLSENISVSFLAQFYLYDERTLDVFNISGADSVKFLLYCEDATYITDLTTTSPIIPILCDYIKFKFVVDYSLSGYEKYYRTFILEPNDAFEVNIFLIDMLTTGYVYNSFILDDLLNDYDNPSVYINKNIESSIEQITANYIDIEGKVGAYLIQNDEYIVELHSDNNPTRVMGDYSADASGDKNLRLYDLSLNVDSTSYYQDVNKSMYIQYRNNSGNIEYWAIGTFGDQLNITNNVTFVLWRDRFEGDIIYNVTSEENVVEFEYNITSYIENNISVYGYMHVSRSNHESYKIFYEAIKDFGSAIFDYFSKNSVNWFILLLLTTFILVGGTIKSYHVTTLIALASGMLFAFFGWFTLISSESEHAKMATIGILSVLMLITVIHMLKKADKETT